MLKKLLATCTFGLSLMGASAMAAPLTGSVSFGDLSGGFSIDFVGDKFDFVDAADNASITNATGTYATELGATTTATFFDFDYGAGFAATKVWSAGGMEFILESLGTVHEFVNSAVLILNGTGYIDNGGEITSNVDFSFSAQNNGTFSWSAGASSVSEPSTLAIFSLGLAGLAISRRKLKKS